MRLSTGMLVYMLSVCALLLVMRYLELSGDSFWLLHGVVCVVIAVADLLIRVSKRRHLKRRSAADKK
jgi:hypothetical protein